MEADTERSVRLRAKQEQMGEQIVASMREKYAKDFAAAWAKVMDLDRYDVAT
jgi:catalase (peroxidase I)